MDYCNPGRGEVNCCVCCKSGRCIYNIVCLPFSRLPAGIYKRYMLLVYASCLPVAVCPVIIIIKYLYFVKSLQKNTAVPPVLVCAFSFRRRSPFNLQLEVIEFAFGSDLSFSFNTNHCTVLNGPSRRIPSGISPFFTYICPVKQDCCI